MKYRVVHVAMVASGDIFFLRGGRAVPGTGFRKVTFIPSSLPLRRHFLRRHSRRRLPLHHPAVPLRRLRRH